ncbi:DUF4381 domain-containing protein [Lacticaseibacillus parakribbianus]|uniref:DUF4381 domain-containing protein n=1 Tax=Lacticaseibacillus parakribbianus TaxID=2970927 RepID=UPI0021CB03AB|nr:DUF4381 domain-containing protein [Lacticaseibacillus parakribbianus]
MLHRLQATLMELVALLALVVGFAWRPQPVAAAGQPLQTVIVKNGEANGYDLILKNNSDRDYRNVTVTATLPKALAGQSGKLTWRVAKFGLSGQRRLPFTVHPQSGRVTVATKAVQVQYARFQAWWVAAGALVVLIGGTGTFLLWRRHKAALALLLIGVAGGGLALTLLQPVAATDETHGQARFTRNGQVYTVTTAIRYDAVGATRLVPFTARVSGEAPARVTVSDRDGGTKRTVALRGGVLATRLVKSHRYRISGAGLDATLTPGGRNTYKVKAATGRLQLGEAIAKNGGTMVLKTTAADLQTAAGYRIDPAHSRVIVAGVTGDYRVGDCLYLPPFGYNYGGAAVRVTAVDAQATQTSLTVTDAKVDAVVATVDAPKTEVSVAQAMFVPAPGVKVSGQPVAGVGMEKTRFGSINPAFEAVGAKKVSIEWSKERGEDSKISLSNEFEFSGKLEAEAHINFLTHKNSASLSEKLEFSNESSLEIKGSTKDIKALKKLTDGIEIGNIYFKVPLPGISVHAPLRIFVKFDGSLKASVKLAVTQSATAEISEEGEASLTRKITPTCEGSADIKGTLTVGENVNPELMVLEKLSPVDLDGTFGFEVEGHAKFGFSKDLVTLTNSSTNDYSIEGSFVSSTKAESKLPKFWGGKPLESEKLKWKLRLFKYSTKEEREKKAAAKKKADKKKKVDAKKKAEAAAKKRAEAAANDPRKLLPGKSFMMRLEQIDGKDPQVVFPQDFAPGWVTKVLYPFGYFIDDHRMKVSYYSGNFPVATVTYTTTGNRLRFKDQQGVAYAIPFTVTNGQITFQNVVQSRADATKTYKVTLSFTLSDDTAQIQQIPGFEKP